MTDVATAAALLDRLTKNDLPPDAPRPRIDGLDLRGEGLRAVVAGRAGPPAWWDAAGGRVRVARADFRGWVLRSANLAGAVFEEGNFGGAEMAAAVLRDARLDGATFDEALLEEADLGGAHLRFATFKEAVLEGANLRGADLWGAKLAEADADKADFREAQLEEAEFRDADVRAADFRGARLGQTDFRGADLRGSDFRGSHPRAVRFDGADLRRANLEQLDLSNCSLAGVRLSDARLDRTRFHRDQLGPAIGEEVAGEYELARRAYLSLEGNFAAIGDPDAAGWAYRRRRRMGKLETRRAGLAAAKAGQWYEAGRLLFRYANLKLVELVCDYGESVPRVLASLGVVYLFFMAFYAASGGVLRPTADGGLAATRDPYDLTVYTLMAMATLSDSPAGMQPRPGVVHLMVGVQALLGIFLTGLLGFVAGNRIRR